jgi:hypothetical protein
LIISNNFNGVVQLVIKYKSIGQPQISHIKNSKLQDTIKINPKAILCGVYSWEMFFITKILTAMYVAANTP